MNIKLLDGSRLSVDLDNYPDECYWCEKGGLPKLIVAHSEGMAWDHDEVIEAVFQCPRSDCKRYYIAYYRKASRALSSDYFVLSEIGGPSYFKLVEFSENIHGLSPDFVRIFNQAVIAERSKLVDICGGGYRKALEFLVKDYLTKIEPEKEEEIKKMWLGEAIRTIKDNRVQSCAKRSGWLGNDELHYIRIWEDKDVSNLKDLIQLTVFFIDGEATLEKYEIEMPDQSEEIK